MKQLALILIATTAVLTGVLSSHTAIFSKPLLTTTVATMTASSSSKAALTRDEQVQVVVLDRMFHSWGELQQGEEQPQINYLAVGKTLGLFGERDDPVDLSPNVMAALIKWQGRPFSECTVKKFDRMAVTDRKTGKPGQILWVGTIKWIDDRTAETSGGVWQNMKEGPGEFLRVHWEDGQWKITATGAWDT